MKRNFTDVLTTSLMILFFHFGDVMAVAHVLRTRPWEARFTHPKLVQLTRGEASAVQNINDDDNLKVENRQLATHQSERKKMPYSEENTSINRYSDYISFEGQEVIIRSIDTSGVIGVGSVDPVGYSKDDIFELYLPEELFAQYQGHVVLE
ncbi:hypothetical protein [Schleiferia thermophila]|uniref:hypothetical protein n=1 Tax=Schleiferia thermophila TaxID=884107 RepID=UPI002FDB75EC